MVARSLQLSTLVILAALLSGACGCAPSGGRDALGSAVQAIAGGEVDEEDTAVVGIYVGTASSLCSGSLIAPNVVLTARHCVSSLNNTVGGGAIDCAETGVNYPWAPESFAVTTEVTVAPETAKYEVAEVVGLPVSSDKLCGFDVAILILGENVPSSEATPYLPKIEDELQSGQEYYAIGYGLTDVASEESGTRRRRDDLFIDCVGAACPDENDVRDSEWIGDDGVCQGDSGGPAIDAATDEVIGITSRGETGCAAPIYGSTLAWEQWLKDTVVYASGMGVYTPPAWTEGSSVDPEYSMPIGDTCSDDGECPTDRCLAEGLCTRPCTLDDGCPDDWICADRDGELVCLEEPPPSTLSFKRPPEESCHLSSGSVSRSSAGLWLLTLLVLSAARRRRPAPPAPSGRSGR